MDEQPLNQENQEKILSSFEASKNRAQKLLEDPEKAKDVLREAAQKAASNKGPFDKIWEDLQLLFALGKAYISGEYREIPVGSIIALLGGLIYSPPSMWCRTLSLS